MRHLLNRGTDSLRYMPVGIGRLTGLRTLGEFPVSAGGGVDGRKACRLESLKNLEHLQVCGIRRLGDVSDVGEAKRLELDKNKYLSCLRLSFDKEEEDEEEEEGERRKNEDDQLLLEALRPPLDLKELEIRFYRGNTVFPSWMTSLTNLKSLDLSFCENCEQLPPLGKLPSLEQLFISYMSNVKRVGDEFLGIESDHHDSSSSSSVVIAFPKLKSLTIELLDELEEWDYGITRTGNTFINIMPRLSSLTIAGSRAGYEMRSLLVEGLSETEPKENENISRQQLAAGREWSPLKIFPTHCTAITIVSMIALQFRGFFSCIFVICYQVTFPEHGPVAMDNSELLVVEEEVLMVAKHVGSGLESLKNLELLQVVGLWDRTTTLKVLQIVACGTLRRRYRQGRAEDWPNISHIPDIMIV
ncbi:hypothetical protein CUMW_259120 [Citrus unshiu]|nr:hypothetical protein CUMW_259120 [Citrus unshiu]